MDRVLISSPHWPKPSHVACAIFGTLAAFEIWRIARFVARIFRTPLSKLDGPRKGRSFASGHLLRLVKSSNNELETGWVAQYGPTFALPAFLGSDMLYTQDPRALTHVFNATDIYWKPDQLRYDLSLVLGQGILVTEGDTHKSQRRIMNPAFGIAQLRDLNDIFLEKGAQLRDVWLSKASETENGKLQLDVQEWLSRATLDIIGSAGFNYSIDSLSDKNTSNPLAQAFDVLFRKGQPSILLMVLQFRYPILRLYKSARQKAAAKAKRTMREIGMQLVREKKRAIAAAEKDEVVGRDLLTLLLKANMATDIPANQRLSDSDVIDQVPTFLVAGHETTSTSTTWSLFALSQKPELQQRLREELRTLPDNPSPDDLNNLPFLDSVVRETLRLHSVVANTNRVAVKDDVIPLSVPIVDRKGVTRSEIRIAKGDALHIPLLALNRSKAVWGNDTVEFKPDRWKDASNAAHVPGVMPGLVSFLHGQRSCIGWRFAMLEMKALLFHLVRTFKFELAIPVEDVSNLSATINRPMIRGEEDSKMPMFVSLADDE